MKAAVRSKHSTFSMRFPNMVSALYRMRPIGAPEPIRVMLAGGEGHEREVAAWMKWRS